MKCVVDLDLLLPPPVPETPHFEEMALHDRNLARFNIKVAMSFRMMGKLWETWSQVIHRQHRDFLQRILTRHCTTELPATSIEPSDCSVTPFFLPVAPELIEWTDDWLCSLAACYADLDFSAGGAVLASWSRHEFTNRQSIEFRCPQNSEHIPIKRTQEEWNLLTVSIEKLPIPYSPALRVYADEGGDGGNPAWVGIVVISESDANQVIQSAIDEFNRAHTDERVHTVHFCKISTERNRLVLAHSIAEKLHDTNAACFVVRTNPRENENRLYARGLGEVLSKWKSKLIQPIYIDTPYNLESQVNQEKCMVLRNQVFQALHNKGIGSITSDMITFAKTHNTPGLGLADMVAYLYLRRSDQEWRDIWNLLSDQPRKISVI